jgi:hypothetical protein
VDCGLDTDAHVALLSRVACGDGSVGAEIMRRSRRHAPRQLSGPLRTAGALRARAESLAEARRQAARQISDRIIAEARWPSLTVPEIAQHLKLASQRSPAPHGHRR